MHAKPSGGKDFIACVRANGFYPGADCWLTSVASVNGRTKGAEQLSRPEKLFENYSMENLVACRNSQREEIAGTVSCLERHRVVFGFSNPTIVLRLSEVLTEFQIVFAGRPAYFGNAVVRNLVSNGLVTQCEASLESSWIGEGMDELWSKPERLALAFDGFLEDWKHQLKVGSDFKLVVADMSAFFHELRAWFQRLESGLQFKVGRETEVTEQRILEECSPRILKMVDHYFARFEAVASELKAEEMAVHSAYMRRHLHPLVLCSPFANRTFFKPLGYPGDYEMVNMMLRPPFEGASLYAKVINAWFWKQPPAEAHRNRIVELQRRIQDESIRLQTQGRRARILNFACGPAGEIQQFLAEDLPLGADFVLLDFNDETLEHLRGRLDQIRSLTARSSRVTLLKKSVNQLFKESMRSRESSVGGQFDFVYCAGLFDYMTDAVCQRLMSVFYQWLAPGGLLLATNVESGNPLRYGMEHLLDWHLNYRDSEICRKIGPDMVSSDALRVYSELTGVNLFIEVRKPEHAS